MSAGSSWEKKTEAWKGIITLSALNPKMRQ